MNQQAGLISPTLTDSRAGFGMIKNMLYKEDMLKEESRGDQKQESGRQKNSEQLSPKEIVVETSKVADFIKRIESEKDLLNQVLEQVNFIIKLTQFTDQPSSDIEDITGSSEELKKELDGIYEKSKSALEISKLALAEVSSKLTTVKQGKLMSEADIHQFIGFLSDASLGIKSARENLDSISKLGQQAQSVRRQLHQTRLKELGLESSSGLAEIQFKLNQDIGDAERAMRSLSGQWLGLGQRLHRRAIETKQHEIGQFQQQLNFIEETRQLGYEYGSTGMPSTYQEKQALKDLTRSIIETTMVKIEEYYESLIVETRDKNVDQIKGLTPEQVNSLNNDFLETRVKETIESEKAFYQRLLDQGHSEYQNNIDELSDPENIARIMDILKKSFGRKMRLDWFYSDDASEMAKYEEEKQLAADMSAAIENEPASCRRIIERYLVSENRPADARYQEMADYIGEMEKNLVLSQHMETLNKLLPLARELPGNSRLNIQGKLSQYKYSGKKGTIIDFVQSLDMKRWEIFRNNQETRELFGEDIISHTDRMVLNEIVSQLMELEGRGQQSVDYGRKLLSFKDSESVPLVIFNAFRESGVSGEYPFLTLYGFGYQETLVGYLHSLTETEIANAEASVPGVARVVRLIKEHPDNFYQPSLWNQKNEERPNPVYAELQQRLIDMSLLYLEKGDEKTQFYILSLFKHLQGDMGKGYEAMAKMLNESKSPKAQSELLECVLRKSWRDWRGVQLILESYAHLDPSVQAEIKSKGAELFGGVFGREATVGQNEIEALSDILGIEKNDLDKTIEFIRLIKEISWHDYKHEKLRAYVELAKQPDVISFIKELSAYHYDFNIEHAEVLPAMAREREKILNSLANIKELFPEFRCHLPYQHIKDQETQEWKNVYNPNPYEATLQSIKREVFFETLYRDQKEAGTLKREFSDAIIHSFRAGDVFGGNERLKPISDEEYNLFYDGLGKLLKETYEENGSLANNKEFFQDQKLLNFITQQPDKIDDILSLAQAGLLEDKNLNSFYINNLEKILSIPAEKRAAYITVLGQVNNSPSQEIQRIKDQLLEQLLETDNPVESYRQIHSVFIQNNLPTFWKVYQIFKILHPEAIFEQKLRGRNLSPYLTSANAQERYEIVYRDLLKTHLLSGNRSLRNYLRLLREAEGTFTSIEGQNPNELEPALIKKLDYYLTKLDTLFLASQTGQEARPSLQNLPFKPDESFKIVNPEFSPHVMARYDILRYEMGASEGQSLNDRLAEIYLRPAGFESMEEAIAAMKQAQANADQRGKALVEQAANEQLSLSAGDLLKGVDATYISTILQNGSVAKEYLGASSSSDMTPFDTDMAMIPESDGTEFATIVLNSQASGYGELIFAIKNNPARLHLTTSDNLQGYNESKLELFEIGAGNKHYGIRTGFPTTEISFIIAKDEIIQGTSRLRLDNLYYEIAQNGFYIPVVDISGRVIFTPEMHDEYRRTFDGLEYFESFDKTHLAFESSENNSHYPSIKEIMTQRPKEKRVISTLAETVRSKIRGVLEDSGVALKEEFDDSILEGGAELLDTGSTGRYTNVPGNYDFDLILKLDAKDWSSLKTIQDRLIAVLKPERFEQREDIVRAFDAQGISAEPIDVDVSFVKKSELSVYGSHDAIEQKLAWVKDNVGENAYEQIVANIILTKRILNEGQAYKRVEHGGFGGIGVENWILANKGNMETAFRTFYETARRVGADANGFGKFKREYKILNAGVNVKRLFHDNYTANMSLEGYQAMVRVIGDYIENIDRA